MKKATLFSFLFPLMTLQSHSEILRAPAADGGEVQFDGVFYDYRDAGAQKAIKLWIPPGVPFVRGVILHGNPGGGGGDSRSVVRDRAMQEFAARFRFGIAGVTWFPGRHVYEKTGATILAAFYDFAKLGKNPELAHVPFIPRGGSNGGMTSYALTCLAPERMICFTPNCGPVYFPNRPARAALKVPALLHVGPVDPIISLGMKDTAELFDDILPQNPLWAWDAEQGKKHEDGHSADIDFPFYETCIALRLPPDADPRRGPVVLREPDREAGWLVDTTTWEGGRHGLSLTYVAPLKEYKGNKARSNWVPDKRTAFLYRGLSSYGKPLELRLRDIGLDSGGPSMLLFPDGTPITSPVVDPGTRVVVECSVDKRFDWERIEFFDGDKPIGVATAGNAPECAFVADGSRAVHSITAVGHDKQGNPGAGAPVHFFVRDPKISALITEQLRMIDAPIPSGARPAGGSSAAVSKGGEKPEPAVLVARELSAREEKEFAADKDHPAAFWKTITGASDMAEGPGVVVKAAHTRAGLYLFYASTGMPADSAIDFHIARDSSREIWSGKPVASKFSAAQFTLSLSESQYSIKRGARSVSRRFPDPYTMFIPRLNSFEEIEKVYGVAVRELPEGTEIFLPWAYVGKPGPMSEPAVGTRLGLVLGYDNAGNKWRWPHDLDPWEQPVDKGANPWGDLEIGSLSAQ